MKHIPLLSKEEADPELRKKWDAFGFDLALFHVWAHVPDAFMAYTAFNGTVWRDEPDGFPLLQKEMAVVHASVLSNSSYEWGNHGASMLRRGGTQPWWPDSRIPTCSMRRRS
jgi:alkylhydroperoxidase family enzyme